MLETTGELLTGAPQSVLDSFRTGWGQERPSPRQELAARAASQHGVAPWAVLRDRDDERELGPLEA